MKLLRFIALSLALVAGWLPAMRGQTAALSFGSFGSLGAYGDGNSRMLGWQFTVTTQLDVLALGWFDLNDDGLAYAHQIGIWDVTNTATPLMAASVPSGTAGTLASHYRYVTLGAPLTLNTGVTYRVAGFDPASGDAHSWNVVLAGYENYEVAAFDFDPRIGLIAGGALGPFASSFEYPAGFTGDGRAVLMGPNLLLATVPEPATNALLMALGAMSAAAWFKKRRRAA